MNALNVDIHLKIQKAYIYIDPPNITVSKTRRHLLDSGLVALIKDVTFVNRENSARPCLVRKTRTNFKSNNQSDVKLKTFAIQLTVQNAETNISEKQSYNFTNL